MTIPIQNIYYLLCYAWNKLDERRLIDVNEEDTTKLLDLFAKVLINGTTHLLKRGLDRYYIETNQVITGIKGKLNLNTTVRKNYLIHRKTACSYDKFSHDILHNQILKTTIYRLTRMESINDKLKEQLRTLYRKLAGISEINILRTTFGKVRLNKNNIFYGFLMNVCEIIHNNIFVSEVTGKYKFRDFIKDDKQMADLFEAFVRNFYKLEASEFMVGRERIKWQMKAKKKKAHEFLPIMETDISLHSENRKIIIDAKYYKNAFQKHFNAEKIRSAHLYQLFAYVKNIEAKDELSKNCEGILLYPTVDKNLSLEYLYNDHKISVRTINLNQHWKDIERDLLNLIAA